jgi:dihydropyrimidine dehydrogenase (NAD+) subunit PreA
MLDHAIGPNIIKNLTAGLQAFLDRHAGDGWKSLEDFRGLRRDRIVTHSKIRRPDSKEYFGGHDAPEGYAAADASEKQAES